MAETGGKGLVRAGVSVYARVTIMSMKQQRSATDDNVEVAWKHKWYKARIQQWRGEVTNILPLRATVHMYFKAGTNGTMETETKNIHGVLQVNKTVTCHVSHLLLAKLKADFWSQHRIHCTTVSGWDSTGSFSPCLQHQVSRGDYRR